MKVFVFGLLLLINQSLFCTGQ